MDTLSGSKFLTTLLWALLHTHWLFSYHVICPLLYVHGYWILFLQEVSYFKQPHYEHCYTHWLFFSYPVICPPLYVHGYWIWFLQLVSYFRLPYYEHCYTLIVLLSCNVSTGLCTHGYWILLLQPVSYLNYTSLWALLHTDCSLIL